MSAFSSRIPESIGCTCYVTPESMWFTHYGAVEPGSQMEPNYECFEHFPHAQHNEPNPILVAFRGRSDDEILDFWIWGLDALAAFGGWTEWDSPHHPLHSLTLATDEQADHARSVLTRLPLLQAAIA